MMWSVLTVLAAALASTRCDGVDFSYGVGVDKWGHISKYCDGERQSPVNLITSLAQNVSEGKLLELVNVEVNPTQVTAKNRGLTVSFNLVYPPKKDLILRGGPLDGTFEFTEMHFHWGSEHTVDMERYPIEMHMVFFNRLYISKEEACAQENGLAVLGFFLINSTKARSMRWIDSLKSVRNWGSSYTFVHPQYLNLANLIGTKMEEYFSYSGSLTTPPCYETVTWIIRKKPLLITTPQLKLFWALRGKQAYLKDNFRPLQQLNNRAVFMHHN